MRKIVQTCPNCGESKILNEALISINGKTQSAFLCSDCLLLSGMQTHTQMLQAQGQLMIMIHKILSRECRPDCLIHESGDDGKRTICGVCIRNKNLSDNYKKDPSILPGQNTGNHPYLE